MAYNNGGYRGKSPRYHLQTFLAFCAEDIRERGYVRKADCRNVGDQSTAQRALAAIKEFMGTPPIEQSEILDELVEHGSMEEANVAIAYVMNNMDPQSDYEQTIYDACRDSEGFSVTMFNYGTLASTFRWLENHASKVRKAFQEGGEHLGQVGEKLKVRGNVIRLNERSGAYGPYVIVEINTESGLVTSFASPDDVADVKDGDRVLVIGKIKKHTTFRGVKQTQIKISDVEVIGEAGVAA